MGYKSYFLNNTTYGADDVNTVFSKLTTQGVSLFNNTQNPLIDLNTATSNLVTQGVDLYITDSCKVIKSGNIYKISEGVCWMSSGECIVFDASGYELTITPDAINYVYIALGYVQPSEPINIIRCVVSDAEGGAGTVPLATINADGTIMDTRQFATAKIAVPTANIVKTCSVTIPYQIQSVTYDVGYSGFNGVLFTDWYNSNNWTYFIDLSDGTAHTFGYMYKQYKIQKSGSNIIISHGDTDRSAATFNIKLF